MTEYTYDNSYWPDYETGCKMEWCLTNGLGSFCSGSLTGSQNRTHQGYMVAALCPPVSRFVTLERTKELIKTEKGDYDLDTARIYAHGAYADRNGQDYLKEVIYDDATVSFLYKCGSADNTDVTMRKTLVMKRGINAMMIGYELTNHTDRPASMVLTPLLNFREFDSLTYKKIPKFHVLRSGNTVSLVPKSHPDVRIDMAFSSGEYREIPQPYITGTVLLTQVALEEEGLTGHFTPFSMTCNIPAKSTISYSVLCNVVRSETIESYALLQDSENYNLQPDDAKRLIEQSRQYYAGLLNRALDRDPDISGNIPFSDDDLYKRLVLGADHFLATRSSTGTSTILAGLPWFADWGRDTMIAFTGLTLCTRRYEEAGQILLTFAHYIKNGLIPNMFPDQGHEPMYNTADASLWYFVAVYRYIKYLKEDSKITSEYLQNVLAFIRDDIFPALIDIMEHYIKGTDYSIYMESNGLIHAGSDLDQVTWMDVRVDDRVMTPRHGCPVEINALWYNALCIMEYLCCIFGYYSSQYTHLAADVKSVFSKAYWNEDKKCLYDVVVYDATSDTYSYRDDSIRPNQVIAVALPFSALSRVQERDIVETAGAKLYVEIGLRSLSKDHRSYHGLYRGALIKRDEAYHQGTAWSYLLGSYFTAYRKVGGRNRDCTEKLLAMLSPIIDHMEHAGAIGGISEVFDGDDPHMPGGCYDQAWSVGELLRAYVEDIRLIG